MTANEEIRPFNLDRSMFVIAQTECPRGHSKGHKPCYQLPDGTQLYCTPRMDAASLRPAGGTWMHTCRSRFNPSPVRFLLSQRMQCPQCEAVFVPIPGEIEDPWRHRRKAE